MPHAAPKPEMAECIDTSGVREDVLETARHCLEMAVSIPPRSTSRHCRLRGDRETSANFMSRGPHARGGLRVCAEPASGALRPVSASPMTKHAKCAEICVQRESCQRWRGLRPEAPAGSGRCTAPSPS